VTAQQHAVAADVLAQDEQQALQEERDSTHVQRAQPRSQRAHEGMHDAPHVPADKKNSKKNSEKK
jgi:hypothetical protein